MLAFRPIKIQGEQEIKRPLAEEQKTAVCRQDSEKGRLTMVLIRQDYSPWFERPFLDSWGRSSHASKIESSSIAYPPARDRGTGGRALHNQVHLRAAPRDAAVPRAPARLCTAYPQIVHSIHIGAV